MDPQIITQAFSIVDQVKANITGELACRSLPSDEAIIGIAIIATLLDIEEKQRHRDNTQVKATIYS